MPYCLTSTDSWCSCPFCNQKANNLSEISNLFGWRDPKKTVNKIPQSYCKECRSKQSKN